MKHYIHHSNAVGVSHPVILTAIVLILLLNSTSCTPPLLGTLPPTPRLIEVRTGPDDGTPVMPQNGQYNALPAASIKVVIQSLSLTFTRVVRINGILITRVNLDQMQGDDAKFALDIREDKEIIVISPKADDRRGAGFAISISTSYGNQVSDPLQIRVGSSVLTTVPNLVGLLSSQTLRLIEAARLQLDQIYNLTGEIQSERLRVVRQDPAAWTIVPVGTRVSYTVELAQKPQQQGVKSIVLKNRHQQSRPVEVFLWDSAVGAWSNKGVLNFGASIALSLDSGRVYRVVAVDRGLINCTDGRPENFSCQRFRWDAPGDSDGVQVEFEVL